MDFSALFVTLIVVTVATSLAVVVTRRSALGQTDPTVVAREAGLAAAEQSRVAMAQLLDANRAVMETERERSTTELDGKRVLIDARLESMNQELSRVTDLLEEFEAQRGAKLDVLSGVLRQPREGLAELTQTTQGLREALSSSKARGQWGERMAEDVLQLAGFVEGIQYRKQVSVEGGSGIPDFTFMLPRGVVLYMDVKFPLDNYMKYLDAESEIEQRRHREDFLRDVRGKVKELAARAYTSSDADTVDCVLLFIPNEQLYGFIQEHDGAVLEQALGHKIVMCSPLTLFAVLAVVRQAVDSFRLERTTSEILEVLGSFSKQWESFGTQMDTLGKRLESTATAFDDLTGTRRRQLERQLDRIEDLRTDQAIAITDPERRLFLEA
ncbi:MAG: DNA recombination protein RmuC [Acidimicrobiia bacterium]